MLSMYSLKCNLPCQGNQLHLRPSLWATQGHNDARAGAISNECSSFDPSWCRGGAKRGAVCRTAGGIPRLPQILTKDLKTASDSKKKDELLLYPISCKHWATPSAKTASSSCSFSSANPPAHRSRNREHTRQHVGCEPGITRCCKQRPRPGPHPTSTLVKWKRTSIP